MPSPQRLTRIAMIGGILLCLPVRSLSAQNRCEHDTSVYCDTSWHGSSGFYQWLDNRSHRFVPIPRDDYQKRADVQIWLRAPELDEAALENELASGVRMLVLDESDVTVQWFESYYQTPASSVHSPFVESVAHINGNPDLPVFHLEKTQIALLDLPEEAQTWQIAMNHPTPVSFVYEQIQQLSYFYTFSLSGGLAVVIRDESMMTNLMYHALDNKFWMRGILDTLCADRIPCYIQLHEPEDHYIPASEGMPEDDRLSSVEKTVQKARNHYETFIKTHGENIKNLPWHFVLLLIAVLWTMIALLMSFPSKRMK